jgi:outer membrane lipoprotein SlyB
MAQPGRHGLKGGTAFAGRAVADDGMETNAVTLRWKLAGGLLVLALAGCGQSYSPNTYDTSAVQKANPVEQGVIVGVRAVDVTTQGDTGAVTGAAAGGIAGSQLPGAGATSALGALGGGLIGSLVGRSADKLAEKTTAFEYIVRKSDDKLISVTQQNDKPLAIGQHVLVIAGTQARIVPDYTVDLPKPVKITPVPAPAPIVVEPIPSPPAAAASSPEPAQAPPPAPSGPTLPDPASLAL